MAKKMLIDATHPEETRVVVADGNKVEEFDFESENKRQLAGNIYLAKVTRVEPSLQAAFVDYGGNRHGFLAFSEIHPDYYQIPVADREALLAEERAYAEAQAAEEDKAEAKPKRRSRSRAKKVTDDAEVVTEAADIPGMAVVDLDEEAELDDPEEGLSPRDRAQDTPVEEPDDNAVDTDSDQPEAAVQDRDEYKAADASDHDETIESVAEEDVAEEIRQPRKPRPRKYKIQEVIKVRQILLVQVVKEERGNKGAALTTYLSLAGRYCVLMPNTARGGGISRKITNANDRKKLKEIAGSIEVPDGAGLIVRTAGAQRTKTEIKRDYEYLQRLWEQIRDLTLKSIAPAKIYEEGNLIKRSIRDLYSKDIDEVLVEGEEGYRTAKDFMKMIMPSHAKNVKHYTDQMPLFARYQVESYLSSMFNPTVQLKSGGYIVIGVTEALVAIDVNSGRATKEGSIEETALKTNLEAADEVARQLRLRDLAGLIVIDFIDMDERRNNSAVEKRFKDRLKSDRARIQVGRISGFGLMEMSRQRLRPGMIEATTQPCNHCHGTGLIRSDDNLALSILRQLEEEGVRCRSREVLLKAPVSICNYLMNQKREHIAQIESRYGLSIRIEADPFLISPDFSLEKFKTATRIVPEAQAPVISVDASLMEEVDEEPEEVTSADAEDAPKKKKRRRRRRRKPSNGEEGAQAVSADDASEDENTSADDARTQDADEVAQDEPEVVEQDTPKKSTRSRSRYKAKPKDEPLAEDAVPVTEEAAAEEAPKPKKTRSRTSSRKAKAAETPDAEAEEPVAEAPKPKSTRSRSRKKAEEPAAAAEVAPAPEAVLTEPVAETVAAPVEPEPVAVKEEPEKPKRTGWWSLGR